MGEDNFLDAVHIYICSVSYNKAAVAPKNSP